MIATDCVPFGAFVPDHPPLAVQLCAVGFVDHVSTGVRLPDAEVWFARRVTIPADCACAADQDKDAINKEPRASCLDTMTRPRVRQTSKARRIRERTAAGNRASASCYKSAGAIAGAVSRQTRRGASRCVACHRQRGRFSRRRTASARKPGKLFNSRPLAPRDAQAMTGGVRRWWSDRARRQTLAGPGFAVALHGIGAGYIELQVKRGISVILVPTWIVISRCDVSSIACQSPVARVATPSSVR